VKQSSKQIEVNSRHIEASMFQETSDSFSRWFALLASNPDVLSAWNRGLAGELTEPEEIQRFGYTLSMLMNAFENDYQQTKLGTVHRNTLKISRASLKRLLLSPGGAQWWKETGPNNLAPDFIVRVEEELNTP
jgi:hypothetical protein